MAKKIISVVLAALAIGAAPAFADNLITQGTGIIGKVRLANGETVANGTDGTITLGRNESGTLTVTAVDDNAVCALTINSGGAAAMSIDTGGAAAVNIGNTNATSVSICNSAACDTISIGTNTDADAISVGDSTDTVAATSALWSITGPGVATMAHYRGTVNSSLTSAASDLTAAQFRASSVFPIDTTANTVDVEVSGALDAADRGAVKILLVTAGGTNAATFTADGAGVTAVTTVQEGAGASCEDVNDMIRVTVLNTNAALVETFCAD